ncbi:MAG: hypothetical protein U5Q16_15795 [Gammaproteobacteria bacterium]|nr:hypothetical protein [Gammaproteobacteria bacterium]
MTSLSPPTRKLWWNETIDKSELIWITVVVIWGIVLTLMMPFWHLSAIRTFQRSLQVHAEKAN